MKEILLQKLGTTDIAGLEFERGGGFDMNGEIAFPLKQRYDIVKFIGNGSYGVVFSAVDKKSGEKCAIKVVLYIFYKLCT